MGPKYAEWVGVYNDNHWKEAMAWSKKTYNVEVIELSAAEKARWDKLLEPMVDKWIADASAKGLPAKQIVEDIKTFKNKHSK